MSFEPGQSVEYSVNRKGYRVGNHYLRRVTSISGTLPKPWLGRWAANMVAERANEMWDTLADMRPGERYAFLKEAPWAKRDDAADRGSAVHAAIEAVAQGESLPTLENEDERRCATYAARFLEARASHVLGVELTLVNLTHGIAGTCDLWDEVDGETWILDWKTSGSVYKEHAVQQVIYDHAEWALIDKHEIGVDKWTATVIPWEPVDRLGIVHVAPDQPCKLYEIRPGLRDRIWTVARAANHIKSFTVDTDDFRRKPKVKVFEEPVTYEDDQEEAA